MEIRNRLFFILIISVSSCVLMNEKEKIENIERTSRKVREISLRDFQGNSFIERKATSKIIKYLILKGMDIDKFHVLYIMYPDSIISDSMIDNTFSVAIELIHQESINYNDSLSKINSRLAEEYEGKEWIPVIPPPTGSVSGKDRIIYYYLEKDSIADFLSQY